MKCSYCGSDILPAAHPEAPAPEFCSPTCEGAAVAEAEATSLSEDEVNAHIEARRALLREVNSIADDLYGDDEFAKEQFFAGWEAAEEESPIFG